MLSGADQHEKSHSCSRGHRRTEQKRVSPRRRTLVIQKPLILSIAHIRVFIRIWYEHHEKYYAVPLTIIHKM